MALIVQSSKENCCVFLLNLPPNVFRNKRQYQFSRIIDYDLTANIVNQHRQHKSNANAKIINNKIKQMKLQQRQYELSQLQNNLSDNQSCLLKVDQGQGASSWLTTLPIADKGYNSTKQLLWNLIWIKLVGLS